MLTTKRMEEMMSASLNNPANLCERLGLQPTDEQLALMDRFAEDEDPLVLAETKDGHLVRAAALCALWRLLLIPGSCVRVISSNKKLSHEFFGFLHEVTTSIDPALTQIAHWHGWRTLQLGNDDAYELRLVSNRPEWLRDEPQVVTTFVILGASSSETEFSAAREVVETHRHVEGVRTIVVW